MTRSLALLLALSTAACVSPKSLRADLTAADSLIEKSRALYGADCAPEAFATAEARLRFARLAADRGDVKGAVDHASGAAASAREAWEITEACGHADSDLDGLPDVIDRCPNEAEDVDGDRDEDGCRDLDPYGDLDGDGLRNVDDSCPDEAEDYDGHADTDGCPETSDDSDGDLIVDAIDECPAQPEDLDGFKDVDGCPDLDNDLDQVPDTADRCPNRAEDIDDFEDEDGCPDDDNDLDGVADLDDSCPYNAGPPSNRGCPTEDADGDGVPDSEDQCPAELETRNGFMDTDGCPDQVDQRVKVERTGVKLVQPIQFQEGTATFAGGSTRVLEALADALEDNPSRRVRIEAHTEAQGDSAANLTLSQQRAEAVFDYLVKAGLPAERFDVEGFGDTKPIDTNRTASGRANNRRIEIRFVD